MNTENLWLVWMLAENVKWGHWAIAYLLTGLCSEHSSLCPCGFLGNICQQPLVMVFVIALLPVTGTTCWMEPAGPLGLHFLLTQLNKSFTMKMFPFLPWWLHLGGSAGIFVEQGAQQQCSSGKGQRGRLSLQQLWRARGAGHGHSSLGAALGARCQLSEKLEEARGWHTYSLILFTHSYTSGFSSQHCFFSLLSLSLFFLVFSYPISYICRAQ